MARTWFTKYLAKHKLPNPSNLPVQFNVLSGTLEKAKGTTYEHFDQWARISTLERGKRIALPIEGHAYFDEKAGELAKTFSLLFKNDGSYYLSVVKACEPEDTAWPEFKTEVLALDLGLRNFLASSKGDLRGIGFLDDLRRYDRHLQSIQKGLQQAGVQNYGECARYKKQVQRIRGFLKTNVLTWLRSILETHKPRKVVIEDLGFADSPGELSRSMNRLLRGFGQGVFNQALQQWSKELGFEIQEIEPAYSSQACTCGFVHHLNRKGNLFECLSCGKRAHADVHGAKIMEGRSLDEAWTGVKLGYTSRQAWREGAMVQWATRLIAQLDGAPPLSPRYFRLVGRAKAGMQVEKDSSCAQRKRSLPLRLRTAFQALEQRLASTSVPV